MGDTLAAQPASDARVETRQGSFGAEIAGVDLAKGLNPADLETIEAALAEHSVIWFRDQRMDHDHLEAFTLAFGAFGNDPYVAPLADRPNILEVRRDPQETVVLFGGGWHSDWSFQAEPPSATILHAKVVPPVGGDTLFADCRASYDALDPALKQRLIGLQAYHSAAGPYGPEGFFAAETGRTGMTILPGPSARSRYAHPLVRTHPVNGRRALFISPGYTVGIVGMADEEAAELLTSLFEHMTHERFIYRHAWAPDMLTMWDNRSVLHHATGGYDGHLRVMHRTTVAGEQPLGALK
jgi:taurine dioxygenase